MLDCGTEFWGHIRSMQDYLWWIVGALLALAVISGLGEYRRRKRRDFDAVGFMPWAMVQVLSLIGALAVTILALQS